MSCDHCIGKAFLVSEHIPQKTRPDRDTYVYIEGSEIVLETPYTTKPKTVQIKFCPMCGERKGNGEVTA